VYHINKRRQGKGYTGTSSAKKQRETDTRRGKDCQAQFLIYSEEGGIKTSKNVSESRGTTVGE